MGRIEELWKTNFYTNLERGNFNTKSLRYIINSLRVKDKPVMLVGAGPSLDNTIDDLKKYRDSMIIISTDVTAPYLIRSGVRPDFIVTIDPHEIIPNILKDINIPIIAPITINPLLFELYKGKIYLFNTIDNHKDKNDLLTEFNNKAPQMSYIYNSLFVGGTCLQVASIFKPSIIFLMGYDLAFTNNKVYCDGVFEDRFKHSNYETKEEFIDKFFEKVIIENGIKTTPVFKIYRDMFMKLVSGTTMKVVNCSQAGILNQLECSDINDYEVFLKNKISKRLLKNY